MMASAFKVRYNGWVGVDRRYEREEHCKQGRRVRTNTQIKYVNRNKEDWPVIRMYKVWGRAV